MCKRLISNELLLLLFSFLTFVFSSYAQQSFYVAPDGSDIESNGSFDFPFKSLEYGVQFLLPGDTLFLRGGEYYNDDFNDGDIWEGSNFARLSIDGLPEQFITIKAWNNEVPVINFDHTYGILLINSSYVVIEGLFIKGIAGQIDSTEAISTWGLYKTSDGAVHDLTDELGIDPFDQNLIGQTYNKEVQTQIQKPAYYNGRGLVANKSHHIILRNNTITDTPSSGLRVQQCDYVIVTGNEVYRCTYWTTMGVGALTVAESINIDDEEEVKITVTRNKVASNENKLVSWNPGKAFVKFVIDEGSGIFLTRNNATYQHGAFLIANNLSYRNGARGIVVHKTDNVNVEHNSLYFNGSNCTGAGAGIGLNSVERVVIRNNIVYSRPDKWALGILAEPISNLMVSANIIFNDFGQENVSRKIDSGWVENDPLFADPESDFFDLQSDSPAIDAADPSSGIFDDLYGNPRMQGNADIGAIEWIKSNCSHLIDQQRITLYPNPVKHILFISGPIYKAEIYVLNIFGNRIDRLNAFPISEHSYKINMSGLAPGIYFLVAESSVFKVIRL